LNAEKMADNITQKITPTTKNNNQEDQVQHKLFTLGLLSGFNTLN